MCRRIRNHSGPSLVVRESHLKFCPELMIVSFQVFFFVLRWMFWMRFLHFALKFCCFGPINLDYFPTKNFIISFSKNFPKTLLKTFYYILLYSCWLYFSTRLNLTLSQRIVYNFNTVKTVSQAFRYQAFGSTIGLR